MTYKVQSLYILYIIHIFDIDIYLCVCVYIYIYIYIYIYTYCALITYIVSKQFLGGRQLSTRVGLTVMKLVH